MNPLRAIICLLSAPSGVILKTVARPWGRPTSVT